MPKIKLEGEIKLIGDRQDFASGFYKRMLVLICDKETKYPQELPIDFSKERGDALDNLKAGDTVVIDADLNGREYNGRYYPSVNGWRVELKHSGAAAAVAGESQAETETDPEDNLPF